MTATMSTDIRMSDDGEKRSKRNKCGKGGKWSTFNIAAMVLGFVFFWPVGLFVLFWIISGRDVKEIPGALQGLWNKLFSGNGKSTSGTTDNSIFNEYQQTQYDRITEIKDEIKDRASRFSNFRSDAKRQADEKEFRTFMENRDKRDDEEK